MEFALSKQQEEIVEKAAWVARDFLAPRAATYDETATHPVENWNDLWEQGLLTAAVPAKYGGLGLDMQTYVMVIEQLAQGCTSTAMTMHMHSVVQRYIDALATPEQKATFYPDVVDRGKLFGSWGSEPESRGGTGVRETEIAHGSNGEYVINGEKHFCTMAGAAHRSVVHCTMRGYVGLDGYLLALVPIDAVGMKITGQWNTLGMRATVSPSVSFKDCHVSSECVLGEPGQALEKAIGQSFALGYSAVYIGAAQRALEFTAEYAKTHQFAPDPTPLAHNVVVQRSVAEMTMALDGARLVLYQSAAGWKDANAQRRWVLSARAKYLATEAALMVTSRTLQTIGGRSAHKSYPLERIFRDIRTCTLMPPNTDRAMQLIAEDALGIGDESQESGDTF